MAKWKYLGEVVCSQLVIFSKQQGLVEKAWRYASTTSRGALHPRAIWNWPRMGGKICCNWWLGKIGLHEDE